MSLYASCESHISVRDSAMSSRKMRQQSRHLPAFILLLLAETPAHGGGIQSALKARLPALKADSGAVYRVLQHLEQAGEVTSAWDTSHRGPARKEYRLTPAGWKKLEGWLEDIERRLEILHYFVATYKRLQKSAAAGRPKASK